MMKAFRVSGRHVIRLNNGMSYHGNGPDTPGDYFEIDTDESPEAQAHMNKSSKMLLTYVKTQAHRFNEVKLGSDKQQKDMKAPHTTSMSAKEVEKKDKADAAAEKKAEKAAAAKAKRGKKGKK